MVRVTGIPMLLSLLTLALGILAAFPDPLKLWSSVLIHDPSLVQRTSDGKYFLFTTHNKGGILTATNLAGCATIPPFVYTRFANVTVDHGPQSAPFCPATHP